MAELRAQSFQHGPLYIERFNIMSELRKLGLKNGDILYRASDARGPFNLPFSRLVARVTKSKYSHAALAIVENGEYSVLEINDRGTLKYRMIDWIDTCYNTNFAIYRLRDINLEQETKLKEQIDLILEEDPDYDFTFNDPNKFYCTESVVEVYRRALGIEIDEGHYIYDVTPFWVFCILYLGSTLFKNTGASLPFDQKMHFVGNSSKGMMASEYTEMIFEII